MHRKTYAVPLDNFILKLVYFDFTILAYIPRAMWQFLLLSNYLKMCNDHDYLLKKSRGHIITSLYYITNGNVSTSIRYFCCLTP